MNYMYHSIEKKKKRFMNEKCIGSVLNHRAEIAYTHWILTPKTNKNIYWTNCIEFNWKTKIILKKQRKSLTAQICQFCSVTKFAISLSCTLFKTHTNVRNQQPQTKTNFLLTTVCSQICSLMPILMLRIVLALNGKQTNLIYILIFFFLLSLFYLYTRLLFCNHYIE